MTHERRAPRIGRLGFWFALAFAFSAGFALSTFVERNVSSTWLGLGRGGWHAVVWIVVLGLVWVAALRRLRDRDRSTLWLVPFIAGPLAAEGLAIVLRGSDAGLLPRGASFVSFVLTVWALIELGAMPGAMREAGRAPTSSPPRRREGDDPPGEADGGGGARGGERTAQSSGRPRARA